MAGNGPDISIAFDLGNSGGKVYAATMDSGRLEILDELVISNELVRIGDRLYWDLFRIFRDFKEAVKSARRWAASSPSRWTARPARSRS